MPVAVGQLSLSLAQSAVPAGGTASLEFQATVAGRHFVAIGPTTDTVQVIARGAVVANTKIQIAIAAASLAVGANVVVVGVFPAGGGETLQASATLTLEGPATTTTGCADNTKNGSETDTDCGGGECVSCANGLACSAVTDCASGTCLAHRCVSAPPTACAFASSTPSGPVLFFSDLTSGPNHGGENDLGVFVTLYGLRLGATRGTSMVTVGGGEVARYMTWNDPSDLGTSDADRWLPRGLERVSVQLGANAASGGMVVVVDNVTSNALHFTVREGKIFFVDPAAASEGDGSAAAPFQHLYDVHTSALTAGSTVYIKGGVISEIDPAQTGVNLDLDAGIVGSGSQSNPIAFIGYPGKPPTIGNPAGTRNTYPILISPQLSDYTFANLRLTHADHISVGSTRARLIGCRVDDMTPDFNGTLSLNSWIDTAIWGNFFYQAGGFIVSAGQGVNVGWNEIEAVDASANQSSVVGDSGAADMVIHDNLFEPVHPQALYLSGSFGTLDIWNNVFSVGGGDFVYEEITLGCTGSAAAVTIEDNSFVDGPSINVSNSGCPVGSVTLRDNILEPHFVLTSSGSDVEVFGTVSHNLYDNDSADSPPFASEPGAQNASPQLTDAAANDVSLKTNSPAIDRGIDTGHCADYFGVQRPRGTAFDIGAVESP